MFPHDARERRCSGDCVSRILRSTPSALRPFIPETQAPALPPKKSVVRSQRSAIRAKGKWSCPAVISREDGFTLLELLIVISIIAVLLVLIAPAFTTIKSGTDVTSAAYTIKGVLDTARTYAKANNTYTWVGFFEEDVSQPSANPPVAGTGRIVISTVASKDGSELYTPPLSGPAIDLDDGGTKLLQVGKLIKLDNMHLRTFPNGTGTGDTFPTRPAIPGGSPDNAKIGDTSPDPSLRYFHYPATGTEAAAQYKFRKMIQFSLRGECRPQNDNYEMRAVIEVGFQPVHGTVIPALDDSKDCAVQLTGFSGNTKIYQR